MKCLVCGKPVPSNRKKFCSVECYHAYRKPYKAKSAHENYLKSKNGKYACMMCKKKNCQTKYEICR